MYYKNASAVILVYDSTNLASFESLGIWLGDIEKHKTDELQIMAIAASKCDMSEQ